MNASNPPTGTITFWFSDIEGSTERWDRAHDAMQSALRRHDEIVRAAIERNTGYVFKTIGDAFCAAFGRADDAVAAALDAQRALASADFSAVDGLHVRIALHAGIADERDGDYFGPAVNRVARLLATAWGGQTVLSSPAAELARAALPAEATLVDLGDHRLKDLSEPERVWTLCARGLRDTFPPLRSLDASRNNLPTQLLPLIGRRALVAEVIAVLLEARLVTLAATGGVGKTRTSLQVAADLLDRFADGVWCVELGSIVDDAGVAAKVLGDLGLRETAGRTPLDSALLWLASREVLLLLDNCEQVVGEAARVASTILARCPFVRILATSREPLGIAAERVVHVPSLRVPPAEAPLTADEALEFEAIELFVERARAIDASFVLTDAHASTVADICRRLDGIALAIELAASRVRVLSPAQLAQKLDERFRLLTGGRREAVPRQATLHAMISWSYELLDERERRVFEALCVFTDAWTIEAGVELCRDASLDEFDALDALEALAKKSLIAIEGSSDEKSYRLLESTRAFALVKLRERGDEAVVRARHAAYASHLAERLDRSALDAPTARWEHEASAAAADLRAALAWALHDGNDERRGVDLVARMRWFWSGLSATEGRAELQRALEVAARIGSEPSVVARLHLGLATVCTVLGDAATQLASTQRARELLGPGGDRLERAFANRSYAQALWEHGRPPDVAHLVEEVLAEFRALGQPRYVELTLQDRGTHRLWEGDLAGARSDLEEAISIASARGFERDLLALRINLAEIEFALGDVAAAVALAEEALERKYAKREPIVFGVGWSNLAMYYATLRRWSEAERAAETALAFAHDSDDALYGAFALQTMATTRAAQGDATTGAALLGFVDARLSNLTAQRGETEAAGYRQLLALLQSRLDATTLEAERRRGSAFSPAEAELLAAKVSLAASA